MDWKKSTILLIVLITAARLVFINLFPLLGDEAYYWQWARHLDIGYYEQGPVLAVVIWLFTFFTKINTVFTVRLGAVVLSCATMVLSVLIYKKLYPEDKDSKRSFFNLLYINSSLIFAAGAILMMHDTVMIFFAALFIYQMLYVIDDPENNKHWALAGLILGVGVSAKLTMGTFFPAVLAFALTAFPVNKKLLKSLLIFTVFFMLAMSPYIYWNFTHDFATVRYLLIRGGSKEAFTLKYLGELVGAQIGLVSPFLFPFFMAAMVKNIKNTKFKYGYFMSMLFIISIVPYLILSLKSRVEANWPVYCFYPLFFITTQYIFELKTGDRLKAFYKHAPYIAGLAVVLLVHIQVIHPVLPLPERMNPLNKAVGYKELAEKTSEVYNSLGGKDKLFIASRHYQVASLLAFYMKGNPDVYCIMPHESRKNYRFWTGYKEYEGGNCLFIYNEWWEHSDMTKFFKKSDTIGSFDVIKNGKVINKFLFDLDTGLNGV